MSGASERETRDGERKKEREIEREKESIPRSTESRTRT